MENYMEIKFSAKSENELFARMAASSFITPLNPTLDEITEIKTIVSEAVTNAIIHGFNEDPTKLVEMSIKITERCVVINIRDTGVGIKDVELAKQPLYTSKPENERSGMGFTIIETFSDDLEVNTNELGTEVVITKSLRAIGANHFGKQTT